MIQSRQPILRRVVQRATLFILLLTVFAPAALRAQIVHDPLLYTHQALQYGALSGGASKVAQFLPGTSFADGFSSIGDNPASSALFRDGMFEVAVSAENVREETAYLGNKPVMDDNRFALQTLGFNYKFPTTRGNLSIGAGYQQLGSMNRVLSVNGRNTEHSITDQFKIPGSYYENIAFDAYATDYWDVEQTFLESIFRIGFEPGEFLGIDQEGEVIERGTAGEFSAFLSTEFQKDLFVGISVGAFIATKSYDRTWLEIDSGDLYNGDFIDTDGDSEGDTDIDQVLLRDEIDTEATAPAIRIGGIYRLSDNLRVGASWRLPSTMTVVETYDATVRSTMDNTEFFQSGLAGEYEYSIRQPGTVSLGFSVGDREDGLAASFSFDRTDHAGIEMDYSGVETFLDERLDNTYIQNEFAEVWDKRGGVSYTFDSGTRVMWSYTQNPSRFRDGGTDRRHVVFGAELPLEGRAVLSLSLRRVSFDQTSVLYNYEDSYFQPMTQTVNRQSEIVTFRAGVRVGF